MLGRGQARQLRVFLEVMGVEAAEELSASGSVDAGSRPRGERRPPPHPQEAAEAAALWQAVVEGRWSMVEQDDRDRDRCLLVRRNDREAPAARALTERERQIVAYASMGNSNKLIAYELGLSSSTVAALLSSARHKLGVSREALLHAFAVLGGGPPGSATLAGESTPPAPHRAGAHAARIARFTHDGQDHAVIRIPMAPRSPTSLSLAEAQVAMRAIAGLSNARIAQERGTSVRTVANQLRSVYVKLGVGSRRQLCSWFAASPDPDGSGAVEPRAGHRIEAFVAGHDANLTE